MFSKTAVNVNFYTILGVQESASVDEIKYAYKQKALNCHPDKNSNIDATEKMQQLNQAYEVLRNEETRRDYDKTLNGNKFCSNHSSEKAYAQKPSPFFNQNRQAYQDRFVFEQWSAQLYGCTLHITHPSLKGCKNEITLFNVPQNSTMALPINFNSYRQRRVRNFLLSITTGYSNWLDGEVEFVFDLPSNKTLVQKIIEGVFTIYKMPQEVIHYVCQIVHIQPIKRSKNNESFEALFETTVHNYKKAQIGEWELSLTAAHLFITHPSLKGCKDNITFFNIYDSPSIALPINGNQSIKEHLLKNLVSLSNDSSLSVNDIEMHVKLPEDKQCLEKMLDVIFYNYHFPEELITTIQKLAILFKDAHDRDVCSWRTGLKKSFNT